MNLAVPVDIDAVTSIHDVEADDWNALVEPHDPFAHLVGALAAPPGAEAGGGRGGQRESRLVAHEIEAIEGPFRRRG